MEHRESSVEVRCGSGSDNYEYRTAPDSAPERSAVAAQARKLMPLLIQLQKHYDCHTAEKQPQIEDKQRAAVSKMRAAGVYASGTQLGIALLAAAFWILIEQISIVKSMRLM